MHPTETEKAQHTAEPLYLGYGRNPDDGAFYLRAGRREVAILDTDNSLIDEANAERIASCWNACLNIPDPASAVPALVGALENIAENAERVADDYTTLEGLRTELRGFSELARLALAQGGKR